MHVDGAVKRFQLAAAHGFHDLIAAEHTAGPLGQRHQQVELVGREFTQRAVHSHGAGVAVDSQRTKPHDLVAVGRQSPAAAADFHPTPQHRPDARQQLTRLKGFGQVVVGPQLQSHYAVHRVALGSQH